MNVGETWEMTEGPDDPRSWIFTVLDITVNEIWLLMLLSTGSEELEGQTIVMPLGWSEDVPASWRLL